MNISAATSAQPFQPEPSRLDRKHEFLQQLSQTLEQQHDGALATLLESARTDSDSRMIAVVGQQYSQASLGQKAMIDLWMDTLSLEQRLNFGEEREFVDYAELFHKMLRKGRDDLVEDLLYGILYSNKSERYFEEIGRQRAHATDDQKKLIDHWQKELSGPQRQGYLSGRGMLSKLNAAWRNISPFVDGDTLLRLERSNKYVGQHMGERQAGRLIVAKASQLHRLSGEARTGKFLQLLSDARALPDSAEEVGQKIEALTALASALKPWKNDASIFQMYKPLMQDIQQLPRPEWRFAPLDAVVQATSHSRILSMEQVTMRDTFLSVDVASLPREHLPTWTQLLATYYLNHPIVGDTWRTLLDNAWAVIDALPEGQRQALLDPLLKAQGLA